MRVAVLTFMLSSLCLPAFADNAECPKGKEFLECRVEKLEAKVKSLDAQVKENGDLKSTISKLSADLSLATVRLDTLTRHSQDAPHDKITQVFDMFGAYDSDGITDETFDNCRGSMSSVSVTSASGNRKILLSAGTDLCLSAAYDYCRGKGYMGGVPQVFERDNKKHIEFMCFGKREPAN